MKKTLTTFEAFWAFYLGEHSLPPTRWMHFVGKLAKHQIVPKTASAPRAEAS
jgi:hypothetical protein